MKVLIDKYNSISLLVDEKKPNVKKLYQKFGFKENKKIEIFDAIYYQMIYNNNSKNK